MSLIQIFESRIQIIAIYIKDVKIIITLLPKTITRITKTITGNTVTPGIVKKENAPTLCRAVSQPTYPTHNQLANSKITNILYRFECFPYLCSFCYLIQLIQTFTAIHFRMFLHVFPKKLIAIKAKFSVIKQCGKTHESSFMPQL